MDTRKSKYGVRDGFLIRGEFALPSNRYDLDSQVQRDLEICNLFVNEEFTISDIVEITRHTYGAVVQALLRQRAVVDRRRKPRLSRPEVVGN